MLSEVAYLQSAWNNLSFIVSGTHPYFGYQAVDSILLSGLLVICWRGPPRSTLLMIILQETNSDCIEGLHGKDENPHEQETFS